MAVEQVARSFEQKASSVISKQLRGVHHVGLTVEDMGKALEFYTEVLGGKVIIPEIGLAGEIIHNTLLQKEEIEAIALVTDPKTLGIPNLRDEEQNLDIYFIQFDNVVLELLQYRDASEQPNGSVAFPVKNPYSSPACFNSMHISFYLKDDVDVDEFVNNLETECHKRGMDRVKCNRIVRVKTEQERANTDPQYNSCKLIDPSFGDFEGWTLVYCKGPNGEQLEFNQVLRKAKILFETAKKEYQKEKADEQ